MKFFHEKSQKFFEKSRGKVLIFIFCYAFQMLPLLRLITCICCVSISISPLSEIPIKSPKIFSVSFL